MRGVIQKSNRSLKNMDLRATGDSGLLLKCCEKAVATGFLMKNMFGIRLPKIFLAVQRTQRFLLKIVRISLSSSKKTTDIIFRLLFLNGCISLKKFVKSEAQPLNLGGKMNNKIVTIKSNLLLIKSNHKTFYNIVNVIKHNNLFTYLFTYLGVVLYLHSVCIGLH